MSYRQYSNGGAEVATTFHPFDELAIDLKEANPIVGLIYVAECLSENKTKKSVSMINAR